MEHQDWKPVIWRKQTKSSSSIKHIQGHSKIKKLDSDDPEPPKKLSHSVKIEIQKARSAKKLTQKQVANMVNLPVKTVSDYESGKAIPNRQILSKFSRILGINLNKIK